ncbi:MAG: hypothetical protein J7M25_03325 [Deltaproteobacteria bacterium]|nr:hypothetical protein [Deltaproteobacteria bacterium]
MRTRRNHRRFFRHQSAAMGLSPRALAFFVVAALFFSAKPGLAQTFTDPDPDDQYSHSVEVSTLDELRTAVENAQPDTIIWLADGRYGEGGTQSVDFSNETGGRLKIKAHNPGAVFFDFKVMLYGDRFVIDGVTWDHYADYEEHSWQLVIMDSDCKVLRCKWDDAPASQWLRMYIRAFRLEVAYNEFANKLNNLELSGGAMIASFHSQEYNDGVPYAHHIHHNYVHNIPRGRESNGYDVAFFYNDDENSSTYDFLWKGVDTEIVYEYNLFDSVYGDGENPSMKVNGMIVRYNTYINYGAHVSGRYTERSWIYGNTFLGNEGGPNTIAIIFAGAGNKVFNNYIDGTGTDDTKVGIQLFNGDTNGYHLQPTGVLVAFNTVINCRYGIRFMDYYDDERSSLQPIDSVFANNLLLTTEEAVRIQTPYGPTDNLWEGNMFTGDGGDRADEMTQIADGGLSELANGLSVPELDSPVLGAAVGDYPDVTEDVQHQTRPDPKSVGACEVRGPHVKNPVLTPQDVGPNAYPGPALECPEGRADCNGDPDDGCEIDLLSNSKHCGDCETSCDNGQTCSNGICQDRTDGGTSDAQSGPETDAGAENDSGSQEGESETSGCNCRASSGGPDWVVMLLLLVLGVILTEAKSRKSR